MTRTHCEISMSLDGFITGPNEGVGNPLGDDDGRLHDWMFGGATDADANVLAEAHARTGAIVMGKRMFDVGVEPWGDPPPFRDLPVFVLTHQERDPMPMQGGTTYHFVTEGLEAALERARSRPPTRTSASGEAPTSSASPSRPVCSMNSRSTWLRPCLVTESASSRVSAASGSTWSESGRSKRRPRL